MFKLTTVTTPSGKRSPTSGEALLFRTGVDAGLRYGLCGGLILGFFVGMAVGLFMMMLFATLKQ